MESDCALVFANGETAASGAFAKSEDALPVQAKSAIPKTNGAANRELREKDFAMEKEE